MLNLQRNLKPELKSSTLEVIYALEVIAISVIAVSLKFPPLATPLIFIPLVMRSLTSKDISVTWIYAIFFFSLIVLSSFILPVKLPPIGFTVTFFIGIAIASIIYPLSLLSLKKLIRTRIEQEIQAIYRQKVEEAQRVSRERTEQLELVAQNLRELLDQQNAMLSLIQVMASHQSDVNKILDMAAREAKEVGQVEAVTIMLEKAGLLIPEIAIDLPDPIKMRLTTDKNKGLLGKAFNDNKVIIASAKDYPEYFQTLETIHYTVKDMAIFPLIGGTKRVIGLLVLINKLFDYNDRKIQFLTTLGVQGGIILENALLQNKLKNAFYETIISFSSAIEAKDRYTHVMHTKRVADLAAEIARELGFSDEEVERIWIGGLLHDVGKLAIPDTILAKQGPLTEEEREIIKRHPEEGAKMLSKISLFREMNIIPLILYHHERYDGKGYPKGLKGTKIPIGANIISIADTYDAIATPRPYNKQYASHERAIEIIKRERGRQFYPEVVDAFLRVIARRRMRAQGVQKQPSTRRNIPKGLLDNMF